MKPVRFKLGGIIDVYKKFLAQKLKQSERWLNNEQIEDMASISVRKRLSHFVDTNTYSIIID